MFRRLRALTLLDLLFLGAYFFVPGFLIGWRLF